MITRFARCLQVACLALCVAHCAPEATEAPDAFIQRITDEALQIVRRDERATGFDNQRGVAQVDDKAAQQFEFTRMTALAVGLSWRVATAEQKQQLEHEFRKLFVRTWYSGWSWARDRTPEYEPLRLSPDGTRAIVKCRLVAPGAPPITIHYRMMKLPDGWKVFDVLVYGVSIVTTYRDSFAEEVRLGGLDGLVRMLVEKNAKLEAADA